MNTLSSSDELAPSKDAPQSIPMLHFVVTCMGRRDMIRQSIEHVIGQPNSTYTLVDYSCPQHTGEWVREHYPEARIVFVEGRSSWHASEARNSGAKTIQDGWLCFIDSDTILHPEFSRQVLSAIAPGTYMTVEHGYASLFGALVCSQEDFVRVGGYDEIIRDWGAEDLDLRKSLSRAGLTMTQFPEGVLDFIAHDDSARTQNCGVKAMELSSRANEFYSFVKDILLKEGDVLSTERLRQFFQYSRDRLLAEPTWLCWPEGDIKPANFIGILRHIFALADGYRRIETETWGAVRLFRIHRDGDSITELLSFHNSHQICLSAPGRTTLNAVSIYGDETAIPVHEGVCDIVITAEPIFLPGDVDVVDVVTVLLAPAPGPALAVEVIPRSTFVAGKARIRVALDDEVLDERDVPVAEGVQRIDIPVPVASPERPRNATVTLTVGGRTQVAMRNCTFLTAPVVTRDEAAQAKPPARIYRYALSETQTSFGERPPRTGWDMLRAEIAWGWTDVDFVCWVARWDEVPAAHSNIIVAIDAKNVKSPHHFELEARVCLDSAPDTLASECGAGVPARESLDSLPLSDAGVSQDPQPVELRVLHRTWSGDYWPPLERAAVAGEWSDRRLYTVLRIPFDVIGIRPSLGHAMGVALLITDNDGQDTQRWLEWGHGTGLNTLPNPRRYNEMILSQ